MGFKPHIIGYGEPYAYRHRRLSPLLRARLLRIVPGTILDVFLDNGLFVRTQAINSPRQSNGSWFCLIAPVEGIPNVSTPNGYWLQPIESIRFYGGWNGHRRFRSYEVEDSNPLPKG